MLTAHLPSGYVLARALPGHGPYVLPVALVGAVFPDLDMIWFYFIDDRSVHHHRYWVHIPAFWAGIACISLPVLARFRRGYLDLSCVFLGAVLMHLVLDSLSGGILWAAPFDMQLYSLVSVPATQSHWILSFILHWSFLAEVVIWGMAVFLWVNRREAP